MDRGNGHWLRTGIRDIPSRGPKGFMPKISSPTFHPLSFPATSTMPEKSLHGIQGVEGEGGVAPMNFNNVGPDCALIVSSI